MRQISDAQLNQMKLGDTRTMSRGTGHHMARLDDEKVREIRSLYGPNPKRQNHRLGMTVLQISARFGVAPGTVQAILNGRTWRHVK